MGKFSLLGAKIQIFPWKYKSNNKTNCRTQPQCNNGRVMVCYMNLT